MTEISLVDPTNSTRNSANSTRKSANSTHNQQNPQNSTRNQQSTNSTNSRRLITGGRKSRQFGIHLPPASLAEKMEEREESKKRLRAQEEIQQSSTNLVKSAVGKLAKNDEHAKKFKAEIDTSQAIPELLREHLGFVGNLPSSIQLIGLVAEKFVRTLIE